MNAINRAINMNGAAYPFIMMMGLMMNWMVNTPEVERAIDLREGRVEKGVDCNPEIK